MEDTTSTTLTTAQIESAMKADTARLDRAEQRLSEARTDVFTIERGPDSDAVKAAKLANAEPVLQQREQDAVAAANVAVANVDQIVTQTGSSVLTLTADEHAVANTRRDDIRDSVNDDPLGDLVTQVRFALTSDDRPALYLYAKFLPRRLSDTDASWSGSGSDDDRQDLRRMLAEIRDRLSDRSLKPLHDKAVALRTRALKLDGDARKRERVNQTYAFQSAHEVAW